MSTASSLSSWALVNSGTKASGYGYWFPGEHNDGATGGGFMPEATGRAWIGKTMSRGAWYYSAEEDVGYCAAIRSPRKFSAFQCPARCILQAMKHD